MVCAWIVRWRADEEAVLVCHLFAEQIASLFAVRDAELFVLAVHEAVVNAVKAVQRAGMEAGTISLSFFVTSADVAVAVEDEGGGVPADVIEQLDHMTLSDVLLAESGRGLLFIREIMDDVMWVEQKGGRRMLVMKMSRNAT
ncbi:ATP-binding protein [Geobacillus stearothermophilus]|nr:ATP-binding protein [Geobacillus stearothermophilus]